MGVSCTVLQDCIKGLTRYSYRYFILVITHGKVTLTKDGYKTKTMNRPG